MDNNLQVKNTGLDHIYINGIPIFEISVDVNDIYKKVARISSLATKADPYFNQHREAQKIFSELHGEGDRITDDFIEDGARDLLPIFIPYQRLIPEGSFDATPLEYEYLDNTGDQTWTNPDSTSNFIDYVLLRCTEGYGDITITVDGTELGTVSLPESDIVSNYLSYDIAGYLGGISTVGNYEHSENIRNNNIAGSIVLTITNASSDFVFDYKVVGANYDAIGWNKALTKAEDVRLPATNENIRISYLIKDFSWSNLGKVKVTGITLKHNSGSSDVTISYGTESVDYTLEENTVGVDLFDNTSNVNNVTVALTNPSDDFSYDLIINTQMPYKLPSPRFEFKSLWNPDAIIFRFQNMDSRCVDQKLNYTSETLREVRVDENTFDEVSKYISDGIKNFVLKELYEAIGYDKKAIEYTRKYESSRSQAKFWLRSEKGYQTQNHYAGV